MTRSAYPDELAQFLTEKCPDQELLFRVWTAFQPFIKIANANEYILADASELDAEECRKAIEQGLCTKVDQVKFVSMGDSARFADLDIDEDLITTCVVSLTENRRDELDGMFGSEDEVAKLLFMFHSQLGEPLIQAFLYEHIEDIIEFPHDLGATLAHFPALLLFYLFGYTLQGDVKGVEDLLLILEVLKGGVPLGEAWSEPGTWLVVTA